MPTIRSTGLVEKSQLTLGITNTGILATEWSSIARLPLPSAKYQSVKKQPPTVLRKGTSKKKNQRLYETYPLANQKLILNSTP